MVQKTSLTRLDHAMNEVSEPSEGQCELLREHLESARTYLLGEMTEEYTLSLRLAAEAVNCISNEDRRHRVNEMIDDLLAEEN